MFTYLAPHIYNKLYSDGKLITLEGRNSKVTLLGPIPLPKQVDNKIVAFNWYLFSRVTDQEELSSISGKLQDLNPDWVRRFIVDRMTVNSILVYGSLACSDNPLIRIHSSCTTGDIFGSIRCDCGAQLEAAFTSIVKSGVGAIIYMAGHEGRGIGLWAKGVTYLLQDEGYDTYEANRELALPEDQREFEDAVLVLQHLLKPEAKIRLLTNNPDKSLSLERYGIIISEKIPILGPVNQYNQRYLKAKAKRGHTIEISE